MEGTILWFNPEKRHGFIRADDGERLRVDDDGLAAGQLFGDGSRGMRVSFDLADESSDEARAVNVTAVPLFAARRARSRGRR